MAAMSVLAAVAVLAAPPITEAAASARIAAWRPIIEEASARFGVPGAWIAAVMAAESGGRTQLGGRPIVSRAGAMGLMQVMPSTYAELARRHGLGADPQDPRDNILAGAAYLAELKARFGYPWLFAAYNAGPARYAAFRARGTRLPAETRAYLEALSAIPSSSDTPPATVSGVRLFFTLGTSPAAPGGLLVPLSRPQGR